MQVSYVNQLMQPMQAHLSVDFKCSGVRFFIGQILKCSPVVSSYFQCLWISSYKPWKRMTQQMHDAATDLKLQEVCLGAKMCSAISTKGDLDSPKELSDKASLHCVASLHLCNCSHSLFFSYFRNLIVKLAPLKLCDIAAAKSKATWVKITPERYCFFLVRSRWIDICFFY